MPRKPINYTKSCVYRIVYNFITYYVGSNTNMCKRKSQHKYDCNNKNSKQYNIELYKFIRENGGWDKWDMVQIEAYPECKTNYELRTHERNHFDILRPSLNINRPLTTEDEVKEMKSRDDEKYRSNNVEKIKQNDRNYYLNNKDKIKEYYEEYKTVNKEKIQEYMENYRKENVDKIQEYMENYRKENVDKIKKLCDCECGKQHLHCNVSRHIKTKHHLEFLRTRTVAENA